MGSQVWGKVLTTADMTSPNVFQPVIPNRDMVLKAIRTTFIVYNNPTFTAVGMKIWSNNGGVPGKLLHTATNTILKADLHTLANGIKEVYFEFNLPALDEANTYHFAPYATGYTGNDTAHLAWMHGFPDGVYKTNVPQTFENLLVRPFHMVLVGADL